MSTLHTTTPWEQRDADYCPLELWGNLDGPLEDGQIHGTLVATFEREEDAIFARRACSCFDELLAACVAAKESGQLAGRPYTLVSAIVAKAKRQP